MQGAIQQPLVTFKSTNEVAQALESQKTVERAAAAPPPYIAQLSSHIDNCWSSAKQAKTEAEDQMLRNQRMRSGIYESDKMQAIRAMGGSEVYVLLTATKCRALEAWVTDIIRPAGDSIGDVQPTELPDIPPDIVEQLKQEAMAVFQEVMAQFQQIGQMVSPAEVADEVREYLETRKDEVEKEIKEEAVKRAARMNQKIDDVLAECNWAEALKDVISDMITMKAGVMKGPVVLRKKRHKWVQGPNGWESGTELEFVAEFKRVSPLDIYPAPDSRGPDDGYLIERQYFTRADLVSLIGVPGYSEENIRKVLADYRSGLQEMLAIDSERSDIEYSGNSLHLTSSEKIEGIEFWGSVQGQMLLDWGMEGEEIDPDLEYEISAIKIGNYVIRAIMNPDKLGRKPYSVDSFERIPGSFWGRGLPEMMSDVQDVCNAVARSIVNNAALASGPMVEVNTDRMEGDFTTMQPWKIFQANNQMMSEQPAIRFYQPTIVVGPLLQAFEFFSAQAEDQTGVPRWAYGNSNLGGAGSTSSGLSMLMTSASRGVKEFVSHVDRIIETCLTRLYHYLMVNDPDESIKGDCQIIAKGTQSLMAKEQQVVRLREVLAMTNNPTDMQIMGLEGRSDLLAQTFKQLDVAVHIPTGKDLEDIIKKVEAQQQAMAQQQQAKGAVPAASPQALDNAGNPAGNPDGNMFQNQEGAQPG